MKRIVILTFIFASMVGCTKERKFYYPDGKLKVREEVLNGKLNGTRQMFWESGKVKWEGYYKEGRENGLFKDYDKNGILISESIFVDGKKDGVYKEYYDSGNVKIEMNYKNGIEQGDFKEYYSNSAIKIIGLFNSGESMFYKYYDLNHNLIKWEGFIDIKSLQSDTLHEGECFKAKIHFEGPIEKDSVRFSSLILESKYPELTPIPSKGTEAYYQSYPFRAGKYTLKIFVTVNNSDTSSTVKKEIIVLPLM